MMNDTTFSGNGKVSFIPVITNATPQPQTNADRIRAMTDEELAQFFHDSVACNDCPVGDSKCKRAFALCKNTALAWLKSQVGVQDG